MDGHIASIMSEVLIDKSVANESHIGCHCCLLRCSKFFCVEKRLMRCSSLLLSTTTACLITKFCTFYMCSKCWTLGRDFLTGTPLPGLTHLTSCMVNAWYCNFLLAKGILRVMQLINAIHLIMSWKLMWMSCKYGYVHNCTDTTASHKNESQSVITMYSR